MFLQEFMYVSIFVRNISELSFFCMIFFCISVIIKEVTDMLLWEGLKKGFVMMERILSAKVLRDFQGYLVQEEKSTATVRKYLSDARRFLAFAGALRVTKELTMEYKRALQEKGYGIRSINAMLASLNCLLGFLGWTDCKVKNLRYQRQMYCAEEKELTKAEYMRLLNASKRQPQLNLVLQTICGTGIRVSELKYFTVEAVSGGKISVRCKSKTRTILVPIKLKKLLLQYANKKGIRTGAIFVTRSGKNLDRSNIWAQMKRLCEVAEVTTTKVFPHNLRKLFARTFYGIEKDIAKLADILGHSNIETTRIYIMTTDAEHRQRIEQLGLIV